MTLAESQLDARIARVVRYDLNSDLSLKYACLGAETVVGTYSGVTGEIAKLRKRSVATVENWAHAARLYKTLRKTDRKIARHLFRELPASHWWLAYDIQVKGYDAGHYLLKAFQHSWSGRAMLGEFDKDMQAGNAPLIFRRACVTFYGLAVELSKQHKQLTKEQFKAVEAVQKAFEDTQ